MQLVRTRNKVHVGVTINSEVKHKIDEMRGMVPRSRFVEDILTKFVGLEENTNENVKTNKASGFAAKRK